VEAAVCRPLLFTGTHSRLFFSLLFLFAPDELMSLLLTKSAWTLFPGAKLCIQEAFPIFPCCSFWPPVTFFSLPLSYFSAESAGTGRPLLPTEQCLPFPFISLPIPPTSPPLDARRALFFCLPTCNSFLGFCMPTNLLVPHFDSCFRDDVLLRFICCKFFFFFLSSFPFHGLQGLWAVSTSE